MTVTTAADLALPQLVELARSIADRPEEWVHRVRLSTDGRWYERLHSDESHEVWLISWLPGQATGFHDHGGVSGAFAVALGRLEEHDAAAPRPVAAGGVTGFGPHYIHDVRNTSDAPAVSVHVYSPPLQVMNRYDLVDGELVALPPESAADW
jgi:predicted metal-dependent enzyme (double-stranded beta helix superfamily)